MKNRLLSALLLPVAAMAVQAATLPFPDVSTARQQAAQTGKPALIIWYGSDWQPNVEAFCNDWKQLASRHGKSYIFGQFDDHMGLDGKIRQQALPIEHFNLPAVILLAPDGSFMAEYSGDQVRHPDDVLMNRIAPLARLAPRFAELVQIARSSTGPKAATNAAAALYLLPIRDAMRHKELTSIINRHDPEDKSGFRAQFCLDHLGMYHEINGILQGGKEGSLRGAQRRFDEAESYVRKVLAKKSLKGAERRQQWLAGLAYVQRERIFSTTTPDKRDLSPLLSTLSTIIKLDPSSQYGVGAAKLHHYWDPSTFNTIRGGYYTKGDQTLGFEKDWHVDVTSSISGPGTYTFSLEPVQKGRMITRNYRLAVNGKVVATAAIPPDRDSKSVELIVPEIPTGAIVEVWLTASCHDGWMEATGFIRMEKK